MSFFRLLLQRMGSGVASRLRANLVDAPDSIASNIWSPLHYACSSGHVDVVRCLLEYRADIDCASQGKSDGRQTPLMKALLPYNKDHLPIQEFQTKEQKELERRETGKRKERVATLLLGRKADVNCADARGRTALHFAAE